MANQHTKFWLRLLNYGTNESQRAQYWNGYLYWKVPDSAKQLIQPDQTKPSTEVFGPYARELSMGQIEELDDIAEELGGHPPYSGYPWSNKVPYMDFSDIEFSEVSFQKLILINASFLNSVFKRKADFRSAVFANPVGFENCTFEDGLRFDRATFTNTAGFRAANFRKFAVFDSVSFRGGVSFQDAKFLPSTIEEGEGLGGVGFRRTKFESEVQFDDASFDVPANFNACEFQDSVAFVNTQFLRSADFEHTVFRDSSVFNGTLSHVLRTSTTLHLVQRQDSEA